MAYCELRDEFPGALAVLQEKKDAIYALYHDEIGKLMNPDVVRGRAAVPGRACWTLLMTTSL